MSENEVRRQAGRYLEARYGKNVWYRAPETFDNMLERWIWAVASKAEGSLGETSMKDIEAFWQGLHAESQPAEGGAPQ